MSDYIPIDCNYYDKIEETILFKKEVLLRFLGGDGQEQELNTKIRDTQALSGEEFILLPDGQKIRMDKIISIDGDIAPRDKHC